jgi:diguanylate cyclase (GGDEF)-like protein
VNSNLSERDALEKKLNSLVNSLSQQKQDLEILVDTVASHGDEINQEMHDQIDTIEKIARTDPLTGLLNRRAFDDAFDREWHHSKREQTPLSVLMIDIDHFKLFNDSFGHYEGDKCLKQVAETIADNQRRSTDVVARFGGEEFIMLLTNCDLKYALKMAEKIRQQVEAMQLHNPESSLKVVTLSIGVASTINKIQNKTQNDAQMLLKMADDYLYVAKDNGRNQIYAKQL